MPPSSSVLSSFRALSLLSSAAAPSRAAFRLLCRTTTVTRQLQPVRAVSSQAVLAPRMAARPAPALQAKTQVTAQQQTRGMKVHSSIKKRSYGGKRGSDIEGIDTSSAARIRDTSSDKVN
ncbi:hypothetical protein DL764_008684 [Monosporascus ibericus]|uniref:Uncharacterized protein n=1 Tax=Monosporascus ibericus TaxID=155417 RepID=A0A4Q4SWV3_9PEZI|nr:hypothetical protein DL764_008684 [Monosporascus ibericus]